VRLSLHIADGTLDRAIRATAQDTEGHGVALAMTCHAERWHKARPFGMLALGAPIRKTLSAAPFENPINTRIGLSLIYHTENS